MSWCSRFHAILSPHASLCVALSPRSPYGDRLKTVAQIKQNKTTADLSPLPFLSLATNCVVWSLYGALLADPTVFVPNLTGALFGLYYSRVFMQYSPSSILPQVGVCAAIVAGVSGLALALPVAEAAPYIGYTGCTLAVILMSSPLATMATVIRDKNTAAMPFVTSLVRAPRVCVCGGGSGSLCTCVCV